MIFRPQFAYPDPPTPFHAETFSHHWDSSNVPALAGTIGANTTIRDIILQVDSDAPFIWRGTKVDAQQENLLLLIQFVDPAGNYSSPPDFPVPIALSYVPAGQITPVGGSCIPNEPEIPCPPSGTIRLHITNPTAAPISYNLPVSFFGAKIRQGECC